jgi:ABC-type multidrug transport system fused ATPase/permease subunit
MSGIQLFVKGTAALINVFTVLYILTFVQNYREDRTWGKWVLTGYAILFQTFYNQEVTGPIRMIAILAVIDMAVVFLILAAVTENAFSNFLMYEFYLGVSNVTYTALCMFFQRVTGEKIQVFRIGSSVGSQYWEFMVLFLMLSWGMAALCCKYGVFEKIRMKVIEALFVFQLFLIGLVIALDMKNMQLNLITDVVFFGMCAQMLFTYYGFLWSRRAKEKYENKVLQASLREQSRYYQEYYQFQELIKRMRHDLANHVEVIDRMEKSGEKTKAARYRTQLDMAFESTIDAVVRVSQEIAGDCTENSRKERIIRNASLLACMLSFIFLTALIISGRYLVWICIFTVVMLFLASVYVLLLYLEKQTEPENAWIRQQLSHWESGQQDFQRQVEEVREIQRWLSQRKEGEGYEKELLEQCDSVMYEVITGNFPVDAMLHAKLEQCRRFNIRTDIQVFVPRESQMEDIHTVGLLGNLLDNAIEACLKGPESERYIYLRTAVQANFWKIRIDNYAEIEEYSPAGHHFATTKEDKNKHGLGMKVVRSMVGRYDGVLQTEEEKHKFSAKVMVKIY